MFTARALRACVCEKKVRWGEGVEREQERETESRVQRRPRATWFKIVTSLGEGRAFHAARPVYSEEDAAMLDASTPCGARLSHVQSTHETALIASHACSLHSHSGTWRPKSIAGERGTSNGGAHLRRVLQLAKVKRGAVWSIIRSLSSRDRNRHLTASSVVSPLDFLCV